MSYADEFKFEIDLAEDRSEIEKRMSVVLKGKKRVDEYWKKELTSALNSQSQVQDRVTVEIKPVESNPGFENCANLKNKNTIYIHSLSSLRKLPKDKRKNINPFCFERNYDDIVLTIIHEYSHALHWRFQKKNSRPLKWIWEGLAVHLSGQLDTDQMKKTAQRDFDSLYNQINLCEIILPENKSYGAGGAIIRYLETQYPGIAKEIMDVEKSSELKKIFEKKNMKCLYNKEDLIKVVSH